MAKLKNYEIDAIYNKLQVQIAKIRKEKLDQIKESITLGDTEKQLLYIIKELSDLKIRTRQLEDCGASLAREAFNISSTGYYYRWQHTTEEELINFKAEQLLPDNLKNITTSLKDRIILANIDGNVQELIDSILAEYND